MPNLLLLTAGTWTAISFLFVWRAAGPPRTVMPVTVMPTMAGAMCGHQAGTQRMGCGPVETTRLRAIQRFSQVEDLLESFAWAVHALPHSAQTAVLSELPEALVRIALKAEEAGRAWAAWIQGLHTSFFTAEMSLESARERGHPVLHIDAYSDSGELVDSGYWLLRNRAWSRCAT